MVTLATRSPLAEVGVDVKDGEGWKKTFIKTGLSDGLDIEVLEGVTMTTELKGLKKVEEDEEKGPPK